MKFKVPDWILWVFIAVCLIWAYLALFVGTANAASPDRECLYFHFDADHDGDIDLEDYAKFAACFGAGS